MFSTDEFIELSRLYVCIRIETYENEESEQLVKRVLNGKYENTAFAIFNPEGTRMLTRGGRSPSMAMSNNRGRTDTTGSENGELIRKLNQIARNYRTRGDLADATLQDFNSLRQALNCSAADQRMLVFVNAGWEDRAAIDGKLKNVFSDSDVIGKFHLDFAETTTDREWASVIHGAHDEPSLMVVRSSEFGLDGQAFEQLGLDASEAEIKQALLSANEEFASLEERKHYEQHVQSGRRQGVSYENEISRRGNSQPETGRSGQGQSNRGGTRRRGGRGG